MNEHLRELVEQEQRELAEIRLKREAKEENICLEIMKRNNEKELNELRLSQKQIFDQLDKQKKKKLQLLTEASVWENIFVSKINELKQMEDQLNRSYENIWKSRDEFCSQADGFVKDFENFLNSKHILHNKDSENDLEQMENVIKNLGAKIEEEEVAEETLDKKLEILEKQKMKLLEERRGPEYNRLEEWIQITSESCAELESRICRKRERANKKNADRMKSAEKENNNLFSIVKLDYVKKLSPFTTDSKPSCSLNLSLIKKDKIL